jgi:hypothetical protein
MVTGSAGLGPDCDSELYEQLRDPSSRQRAGTPQHEDRGQSNITPFSNACPPSLQSNGYR